MAITKHENGLFVTFEGPEGSGKSTHIRRVAEKLVTRGYDVHVTREPGGTPLGEELRQLIKHFGGPDSVCDEAELLMFGASRAQHMRRVLMPHLDAGGVVLCDRFADSTTVYQGLARGLDMDFITRMHDFTVGRRWPDLTLLLDIDVETGFARARERAGTDGPADRIEAESKAFHQLVRNGFLNLAKANPDRFRVVSTSASPDDVHALIMEAVDHVLA